MYKRQELERAAAAAALHEADAALSGCLNLQSPVLADRGLVDPEELSLLPTQAPAQDVMPWLRRRLQVLVHDAARIHDAAVGALSVVTDKAPATAASA